MKVLRKLWAVWRHGVVLVLVYGAGLLVGFLYLAAPALLLNAVLGALGAGMNEDALFELLLVMFPVWAPLGVGMAARYSSSDDLKPGGYSETRNIPRVQL